MGQTDQTEIWALDRPNRPKYLYWTDRLDRNMDNGQTEQTIKGYRPDGTDKNMGIFQTKQT